MSNEITFTGRVSAVLPVDSGTSASGKSWRKQTIVITEENVQYPASIGRNPIQFRACRNGGRRRNHHRPFVRKSLRVSRPVLQQHFRMENRTYRFSGTRTHRTVRVRARACTAARLPARRPPFLMNNP